ncbi:sugar phosphate isomerase/epimerase [Saprospiraceae bacterium]|nr:sugar phosphate isomerase/epimerase [Saprospiraceae bacterium]
MERRKFNKSLGIFSFATLMGCKTTECANKNNVNPNLSSESSDNHSRYQISLAQWSCHRMLQNGQLDNLGFAGFAANLGFTGVEYVSRFLEAGLTDTSYWNKMNEVAKKAEVQQLLIMTDLTGSLGARSKKDRQFAIVEHIPWIYAAKALGCHSIRVNLWGEGTKTEQREKCTESLASLAAIGADYGQNIIVENHGGYSSDAKWLSQIMNDINMPNCGTLPDFGNFCIARESGERWGTPCIEQYDRYLGVEELMPYAKAVSAKSHAFDKQGNESSTNFTKMMKIIHDSDFEGFIGVEWEGDGISETAGIKATKALIERTIAAIK